MKRREFTNLLGLGLLAGSLPVAIAACQSDSTSEAEGNSEFTTLGSMADLVAQGSLTGTAKGQDLVVVRDSSISDAVLAVSPICTHAGCTVDWDRAQELFVCPCHGGRFNPDGTVSGGPPPKPLTTFEAKIEGDQVLVKV
ncbi:Rieske (2Fe-2S) protein [Nodosilinea sp. LEGE 07298]|uniref:QcrA and Rieske domain-containing protein n=1 Tax=Nodosilinea sp. LEGE 07298 TaxID=2777970 RepID=UPI0018823958|nr:Rieske (2Fe-2S) protein [Nodosilinea sp. LEGE 07298]MBE9112943.1 Rieske (2Fe-2S) protein [Nodosilinea sp. LEGE 07298]